MDISKIFVLVLTAIAFACLVAIELNSRRNARRLNAPRSNKPGTGLDNKRQTEV